MRNGPSPELGGPLSRLALAAPERPHQAAGDRPADEPLRQPAAPQHLVVTDRALADVHRAVQILPFAAVPAARAGVVNGHRSSPPPLCAAFIPDKSGMNETSNIGSPCAS